MMERQAPSTAGSMRSSRQRSASGSRAHDMINQLEKQLDRERQQGNNL